MTALYGVLPEGFVYKPAEVILEEQKEHFRAAWGDTIDTSPQSDLMAGAGAATQLVTESWDLAQDAYIQGSDANAATGRQLDIICALTATKRAAAQPATVTALCCGDVSTVLTADQEAASVDATRRRFTLLTGVTLAAVSARANGTVYAPGDLVYISGTTDEILICTVGGTSGGSAPTVPAIGSTVTDGGVTWRHVGSGLGAAYGNFVADIAGETVCLAGQFTRIETPLSGWQTVYNIADATFSGADEKSDAALRLQRIADLNTRGAGLRTLRTALQNLTGVTNAYVLENVTEVTDGNGIPPHGIWALVTGGDEQEIANAIFEHASGGTPTHGTVSKTVTDDEGVSRTIKFSRPSAVNVYITVNLTVTSAYPATGDDDIEAALLELGTTYVGGDDVVASRLDRVCWIAGVTDVECLIGTSPSPSGRTTIATTVSQIPVFDSTRIVISR